MSFAPMARHSGVSVALQAEPTPRAAFHPATPLALFGELFVDVQMLPLFADGKAFADATLRHSSPATVRDRYARLSLQPGFSLAGFVHDHFEVSEAPLPAQSACGEPQAPLREHIGSLWPRLVRRAEATARPSGSLLPLPHPYVVPGGRFREMYYWDSYFTMLGLVEDGRRDLAEGMLRNIAQQIDSHGHVSNGNRSYLCSRSQPPFFHRMVALVGAASPAMAFAHYLPQLVQEHAYWMAGEAALEAGQAFAHVVRLDDGSLLNRYWDARDDPREESYREDVLTAQGSRRAAAEVWRDLRAAAESGWDFSSRWCAEPLSLASIETTSRLPVDLNSLLWGLEGAIQLGCLQVGDSEKAAVFARRAEQRRVAIDRWLWHEPLGHYVDYHWAGRRACPGLSGAALVPLYVGVASEHQARRMAAASRALLLRANGLLTTTQFSGQQWDAPNGWAPLQWMAVAGLRRYGHEHLAQTIALRWLGAVERTYLQTGKLLEKYDVCEDCPGSGGEYPTQDGFGWTNGVVSALAALYPTLLETRAR